MPSSTFTSIINVPIRTASLRITGTGNSKLYRISFQMPHFMAYFGLDEYIVMSLIMTQSGNSFLKIKGIFTTSTKEEIVDYLTEYFTKFLFIIKR